MGRARAKNYGIRFGLAGWALHSLAPGMRRLLRDSLRGALNANVLAYGTVVVSLVLGFVTFALLSSEEFITNPGDWSGFFLAVNIVALVVLIFLVGRQVLRLLAERRKRLAGYQLHLRLVTLFGVITVLPAIIIVAFSFFVLDYSLRGWFSERISTAIDESVTVAESYLAEHIRGVEGQALAMANSINSQAGYLSGDRRRFDAYLSNQVELANLSEAIVIDSTGRVIAKSRFAYPVTFGTLDEDFFALTRTGKIWSPKIVPDESDPRVRVGVRLNQFIDAYLLVGKLIDPNVSGAVSKTRKAEDEYRGIDLRQFDLKVSFAVLFGMVALLLLFGSVWIGLNLATAIVEPLGAVITVAEKVRGGDFDSRVAVARRGRDEIARLGLSFNSMLDDINRNRIELVEANRQLDARREFTEAVLGGVASGVIGIDAQGCVTLPNAAALEMLGLERFAIIGKRLDALVPEFAPLLDGADKPGRRNTERNVELIRGDATLNLLARITTESIEGRVVGYVVTFEDVSDLLDAQRKAAWSDVARRIAHEIKNPLTPIQLAAEQLGEKYQPQDEKARENFTAYVETIKRQVGDIGRLVNEFSNFARMPAPAMRSHNLVELLRGQVAPFRESAEDIEIVFESGGRKSLNLICDDGMMRQMITNLLQNAVDAISQSRGRGMKGGGKIRVAVSADTHLAEITVSDNGPGLPEGEGIDLTAPYITFSKKGTGLGLAIVRKIAEDHYGTITLGRSADKQYGGAEITVALPRLRQTITKTKAKRKTKTKGRAT